MLEKHVRFWSRYALKRADTKKVDLSQINALLTSNPDDEFIRTLLDLGTRHRDAKPQRKRPHRHSGEAESG